MTCKIGYNVPTAYFVNGETQMKPPTGKSKRFGVPGIVAGLLALAMILAGCTGPGGALEDDDNEPPNAELQANTDVAWSDEQVTFNGKESNDEDGNVTEWHFSFGDGTEMTVNDEDEAEVDHQYRHGGEFVATLTVRDDGGEQTGERVDTDSVDIAVNERQELVAQVIYASPANESETATYTQPMDVYEGIDRYELEATVESVVPAGASEIHMRVVDPSGETVGEDSVTVNAGENETVTFGDVITDEGTYDVVVEAESGGASVHGEFRTYYDADFV